MFPPCSIATQRWKHKAQAPPTVPAACHSSTCPDEKNTLKNSGLSPFFFSFQHSRSPKIYPHLASFCLQPSFVHFSGFWVFFSVFTDKTQHFARRPWWPPSGWEDHNRLPPPSSSSSSQHTWESQLWAPFSTCVNWKQASCNCESNEEVQSTSENWKF